MNRKLYTRLLEEKILELERETRISARTIESLIEQREELRIQLDSAIEAIAQPEGKDDGYDHLRESADHA